MAMRFLTNENIAASVVAGLRDAGHDVLSVRDSMRGASDAGILARAVAESRVLVTFDKDFGELAFRSRLPAACGVVLFRITQHGRERDTSRVLDTLQSRADWSGAFWTVTDQRIRRRPLPNITEWTLNEAETRAARIDPAVKAADWGVVEGSRVLREHPITLGRLEGVGGQYKLSPILTLRYNNAIADAVADLGQVFAGFQKYLYQEVA